MLSARGASILYLSLLFESGNVKYIPELFTIYLALQSFIFILFIS